MAEKEEKQSATDPPCTEFPSEWLSQHCNGTGDSFSMSNELAATFSQLKVMNEAADIDGSGVLEYLLNSKKSLQLTVDNYKVMMERMPINSSDLQQDSLQNFDSVVHNSMATGGNGSNDVMTELASMSYEKEMARMEIVSQNLDLILDQIGLMKQQFTAEFGESDDDDDNSKDCKAVDSAEFLDEKVKACKKDYNEEDADKFFGTFKAYKEIKDLLEKLEKEKKVEAKLDAALARFKDLPPDFALANDVLKKQEKEMKDLNAEIEFLKNNMADGALDMFNP